jgi:ribosomal protein S18 acetylase RimI-like enzyme
MEIRTRVARADEWEWLYQLHRATMRERFEALYEPWDEAQQRVAFDAREDHVEVIEADGVAVGAVHSRTEQDGSLYLQLIEVLPAYQSNGIGTSVFRAAISGAKHDGRDTTLETHKLNPARRLYERLGFVVEGETDTHLLMRRRADAITEPSPPSTLG